MITRRRTVIDAGRTEITAQAGDGRQRVRFRSGLLRAQQVGAPTGWSKIGLIASTALLLGGDDVELEITVGPGARLWLFDVAGTVAYDGRGHGASWRVRATVAEGAELIMAGEPFVVSAGADVDRSFVLEVADDGRALIRETLVLGRSGETGGRLRNRTMISRAGIEVALEDQRLDPDVRGLPGLLGAERVLDTITRIGCASASTPTASGLTAFSLLDDAGTVSRWIGRELADSPVHAGWATAVSDRLHPPLAAHPDRAGQPVGEPTR